MDYKFMQLYGNCAATHYLGPERLRGPVDNVITKGLTCLKLILDGKYCEYLKNNIPTQSKRTPNFEDDSPILYSYDIVDVVHQNPKTEKYITEVHKRELALKNFIKKINTNDQYYLTYTLNIHELNNKTHSLKGNILENNIMFLKEKNLLDKIIFVGTCNNNWWDFWSNQVIALITKYNLKYIELNNVGMGLCDDTETIAQFEIKAKDVIEHGTNLEYLRYRNKNERNNYMKYVIMCGGNYKNFTDLPKHFIKVNDEPVVKRTIRLLQENGINKNNIIITTNNPLFKQCGVKILGDSNNTFTQDAPWTNMKGYWLDAFYPFNEPVCYIFGDVFYSKKAIKKIVETSTNDIIFFGADPAKNPQGLNMKKWEEPLGFKVVNQQRFRQAIIEVKKLFDKGKTKRHPIAWELYRYLNGYDINKKKLDKNFICINDISTDVDKPEDAKEIEKMLKLYGEDLIKPIKKQEQTYIQKPNTYLYF